MLRVRSVRVQRATGAGKRRLSDEGDREGGKRSKREGEKMMTRKEVAAGLVKVERAAEEFFEIDGVWPQGDAGVAVEE